MNQKQEVYSSNYSLNGNDASSILSVLSDDAEVLKRPRDETEHGDYDISKRRKVTPTPTMIKSSFLPIPGKALTYKDIAKKEIKEPCAPYFYYKDFGAVEDPDPSMPVTAPGRIPNFPAKMYAILSRPEYQDIVSWMPHGRSWKVHKPREFEIKVIPAYFEHNKFSSFIRQANGWGFRRMMQKGRDDRNSYYHELFLRGKPHLLKEMKRPSPNMKPQADPSTEPDFKKISEESPLADIHANKRTAEEKRFQPTEIEPHPVYPAKLPPHRSYHPHHAAPAPAPMTDYYSTNGDCYEPYRIERQHHHHQYHQPTEHPPPAVHHGYYPPAPAHGRCVARAVLPTMPTSFFCEMEEAHRNGVEDVLEGVNPRDDSFWLM